MNRLAPILVASWLFAFCGSASRSAARSAAAPAPQSDEAARLTEIGGRCARLDRGAFASAECAASRVPAAGSDSLKIVSYNIRWRSGDELRRIIDALKGDRALGGAQIIGLQEADRDCRRSRNTNTARLVAAELGMNYAWAAPASPASPASDKQRNKKNDDEGVAPEEETGVAILSPYPLSDVVRLILPHPGPGGRRRAAVGATLHIGDARVRVYSVHAETRVSPEERTEQLARVLDDLDGREKNSPAVVLGDFNSWQPASKRDLIRLFTEREFATPFPPGQPTFRHRLVRLRLDWIWLRGFAPAGDYGVARHLEVSDHYPLWLVARPAQATQPTTAGDAVRARRP